VSDREQPPERPDDWYPPPPEPGSPETDSTRPIEVRFFHRGRYQYCHYVDSVVVFEDDAINFTDGVPPANG